MSVEDLDDRQKIVVTGDITQVIRAGSQGSVDLTIVGNSGLELTGNLLGTTYNTTIADSVESVEVGGATPEAASIWKARNIVQVLDTILFPTVLASVGASESVSLSVSGESGNTEVGTNQVGNLTAAFSRGTIIDGDGTTNANPLVGAANLYTFTGTGISSTPQASNVLAIDVTIVFGSNNWAVTVDYDAGTGSYFDNKGNAGTNLDSDRVAGSTSDNSSSPTITGRYFIWYGVGGTTPTNSAEARALNSEFDTDNSFEFQTGSTETKFKILLPPGRTISSVIDLDALNADITSSYVLLGTLSVNDAGGTPRTYNQYEMNIGSPYSSNHRHSMTFTGTSS